MRTVRVFISSPGDVVEERAAAREMLESLPRTPFLHDRLSIDLVAWDDPAAPATMPANLRPQDAVNRIKVRPSQCDLTIVILWSRMGTPLPQPLKKDGTQYLSGTEWEFQDALDAGKKVLLYRRTAKVQVDLDDPAVDEKRRQRRLVEQFFSRFTAPDGTFTGSYATYDTVPRFKELLRQNLEAEFAAMLNDAPETAAPVAAPPLPPAPRAVAEVTWSTHAFVAVARPSAEAPLLAVACVLVDNLESVRRLVVTALDDLVRDPQLRDVAGVGRLRREGATYWNDDPEVRTRLSESLLAIPFEAFVWVARTADAADGSLDRILQGLLRDRLAAERTESVAIDVDSRSAGDADTVRQAAAAAVQEVRASDKRPVAEPTVAVAAPSEPMMTVARYAAAIVVSRLHDPGVLEIRAFERFHPSKIRVVHEDGTRDFFDRRRPLR